MAARSVLWIDLRTTPAGPDLCTSLPPAYRARRIRHLAEVQTTLQRRDTLAACFEYDRPDECGLQALAETKTRYSWLPVIMLTELHNDALAAWALKRCVWDYLVKPVSVRRLCDSLISIYRSAPYQPTAPQPVASAAPGPAQLSRGENLGAAVSYVEANYAEKIQLATVARICRLSPFQFSRNFKKEIGLNFRDYIVKLRIQRAAELIKDAGASVTEAAFVVGFNDLSYFARMFRRQLGVSPSHYRGESKNVQLSLFPPDRTPE